MPAQRPDTADFPSVVTHRRSVTADFPSGVMPRRSVTDDSSSVSARSTTVLVDGATVFAEFPEIEAHFSTPVERSRRNVADFASALMRQEELTDEKPTALIAARQR
jgi:hypothetical protein